MGIFDFLKAKNTLTRGYLAVYDTETIRQRWEAVENLLVATSPAASRQAVLDADKVLEYALERLYPKLTTTGERLKAAKESFEYKRLEYDQLWFAHKVRNEMVHNVNFEMPAVEAKNVVEKFKAGLQQLGALR